jgi:glycosyltransferase involved in cell wall biosynthesis
VLLASDVRARWRVELVDTAPRGPVTQEQPFYVQRLGPSVRMLAAVAAAGRRRPLVAHIHSNMNWALYRTGVMVEILRRWGVPSVVHLHGGDLDQMHVRRPAVLKAPAERALRRAGHVLVMTRATEDFVRDALGVAKVSRLPNFTELGWLGPEQHKPPARPGDPVRVLFVGAVMAGKGVFELLDAAAAVPELRVDVAGPWMDSSGVRAATAFVERAQELALTDRVTFHGELDRTALAALYCAADLFCLPSHREGFPLVVVEAMAAGLPVVATPVGAVGDLLTDSGGGVLVPVGDARALAKALSALAQDPDRRAAMGRSGEAYARSELALQAVLPRLEALWREVGERGTRP